MQESMRARIKTRRTELGLSQKEFGERLGVSTSKARKYEISYGSDVKPITCDELFNVAFALRRSMEWFVTGWLNEEQDK
jgi:transcriptional regulator with XRE-family HTH domain